MTRLLLSIGAMKAGTTWLYDKLKQHPEISFSHEKEIHYFAQKYDVANSLSQDKRQRRMQAALRKAIRKNEDRTDLLDKLEWYGKYTSNPVDDTWFLKLFESRQENHPYLADFSNLNCHLEKAHWKEVQKTFPDTRVLYIMRDPIKRIWSHFKYHLQFSKHENRSTPDKDQALFKLILNKSWFRRNADYAKVVGDIRTSIPRSNLMVFYFEDMVSKPLETLQKIETFLDISHFKYIEAELSEKKNQSIDTSMPDDWKKIILDLYSQEFDAIKNQGIWHTSWGEYSNNNTQKAK